MVKWMVDWKPVREKIRGRSTLYLYAKLPIFMVIVLLIGAHRAGAQELITSTPVRIDVPTALPVLGDPLVTETPTRTPTVPGPAMLEAKADAGDVNVRADADLNAEILGTIRAGDFYPVLGKYYRWYQIQFDLSPSGRAFVFEELVNIIGDASAITDLVLTPLPTDDPTLIAITLTQEAITQTPGGILTATAEARGLALPAGAVAGGGLGGVAPQPGELIGAPTVLPTFTYPPDIIAIAPTQGVPATPTANPDVSLPEISDGVPPIVPIVLLGGMGLLGLAVSSITRR